MPQISLNKLRKLSIDVPDEEKIRALAVVAKMTDRAKVAVVVRRRLFTSYRV